MEKGKGKWIRIIICIIVCAYTCIWVTTCLNAKKEARQVNQKLFEF